MSLTFIEVPPTKVTLKNWVVINYNTSFAFMGEAHGHPRHYEGELVITTPMLDCDDECFISTSGTRYFLGDMHASLLLIKRDAEIFIATKRVELLLKRISKQKQGNN